MSTFILSFERIANVRTFSFEVKIPIIFLSFLSNLKVFNTPLCILIKLRFFRELILYSFSNFLYNFGLTFNFFRIFKKGKPI